MRRHHMESDSIYPGPDNFRPRIYIGWKPLRLLALVEFIIITISDSQDSKLDVIRSPFERCNKAIALYYDIESLTTTTTAAYRSGT